MLDQKNLIELLGHSFAKRPTYSFLDKSIMVMSLLGIATSVIYAFLYFSSSNIYIQALFILIPMLLFVILIAAGTLSAKCTQCHHGMRWHGFIASRDESIKIRSAAIKFGLNIILSKAQNGELCPQMDFDTFVCDKCRIIYLTNVSDSSDGTSS